MKLSPHLQIFIGILLGFLFAVLHSLLGWDPTFVTHYIKPFGTLFLNSLKLMAIPLIITSLIIGISSVEDATRLSRIGSKTLFIYLMTTAFSVSLGLLMGNVLQPGKNFPAEVLRDFRNKFAQGTTAFTTLDNDKSWVEGLSHLIPENLFSALSDNNNLLQIVLIAIIIGIALLNIPTRRSKLIIMFCQGMNDTFIEIIKMIMSLAPLGTFALIASLLTELSQGDVANLWSYLQLIAWYVSTVILGLSLMTFVLYPLLIKLFTPVSLKAFFRAMQPVQLVAFSTSSSSATLPVTIERVEQHLGVPEEISSFVLPLGATVNMDGTALYQGIATLFIAQAFGIDLSLKQQLIIVLYVTTSSIGVAGVPGASLATTMMLLNVLHIPVEKGIALIYLPDRILDMCRTVTNVTGDAAVSILVAHSEGHLSEASETSSLAEED